MAPPRRILKQQLEILLDFLDDNKQMAKGVPVSHVIGRQKWAEVARKLNAVESGALKTPDGWKKYWFEWRHKCRRKVANAKRYQDDTGRHIPLNELELRALELSGKGAVTPTATSTQKLEEFLAEDSDYEPPEKKTRKRRKASKEKKPSREDVSVSEDEQPGTATPPPKWALDIEKRRIAAEERMATALESIASVMQAQEERRTRLDEQMANAVTAIAGTVQDLNTGIQEALQHLQHMPTQSNGPDLKGQFFL